MAELTDIDGIGNTIEERLEDIGVCSVNELANVDASILSDAGIGETRAEDILEQARVMGATIQSASEVEEQHQSREHIPTGIEEMDEYLSGGFPEKFIIGLSGDPKVGKTQFIFNYLSTASEETKKPVVYIETEPERFDAQRLRSICDSEDAFNRIHKIEAHGSLEQQEIAYQAVSDTFDDVALIAVDSFVANFRLSDRFQGRSDFKERSNVLGKHLIALQDLAGEMNCPIILTLQVYGNPKQYDNHIPIWGGSKIQYTVTCRLHISHGKQELRELELSGHSGRDDRNFTVAVTDDGVESY